MSKVMMIAGLSIWAPVAVAVVPGQSDTFPGPGTENWIEGAPSPNQPFFVADGGPTGLGDGFIRNVSEGGGGPGSRMVMFNRAQWNGDYIGQGITTITLDARNSGNTDLFVRLAFQGLNGTRVVTNDVLNLSAGSDWTNASFSLTDLFIESGFIESGGGTIASTMSSVFEMRILSAQSPSFLGDVVDATLDIDNINAVIPAPGAAALLGLAGLAGTARRRR